jgi:hypothetical protein
LTVEKLLAECEVRRGRRRGPGGQHRNKVETAVVILHRPTGIVAEANERRSLAENHAQAVARLRTKLAVAVRSPVEGSPATSEPSELWQQRCGGGRISVSTSHEDFPALLAEALDATDGADLDLAVAAERLRVTNTQLARFLQQEPTAWTQVNNARRARGLRPLKG